MAHHAPIIIKKKKGHGHGHHGGAWKVAYADFVTAMMAFFMVMWIMGLSAETRAQVSGYFNDPLGFSKNQPRTRSIFSLQGMPTPPPGATTSSQSDKTTKEKRAADEIRSKVQKVMDHADAAKELLKNFDIKVTKEGLRVELVEATYASFFQSGSAVLRPEAKDFIDRIAPILESTGRKMIVEGHTDAQPYPGREYTNWDLSTDRALALRRELAYAGVPDNRFLSVRGLAATDLRRPDQPLHFSNRRVTILLPYTTIGDKVVELPKEAIKNDVRGVFRQPVTVSPSAPDFEAEAKAKEDKAKRNSLF